MSHVRSRPIHRLVSHGLLALGLVAVGMVQLVAGATAAPSPSAAKPKGDPVAVNLRIATFNTAATQSVKRAVADIKRIAAESPDVIALQEMGSGERRKQIRAKLVDCKRCLYDAHMPASPVPGSTPILYRSDRFELLGVGTRKVTEDTFVGEKGAGPATIRAKYVNWIQLRELSTGRQVYVLNNHAVPTVQATNGGPNKKQPKRVAIFRKHMAGLTALMTEIREATGGATIFVTGDLNVNFRKDRDVAAKVFPYYTLGQLDTRASFETLGEPKDGTHVLPNGFSLRLIDYVYYLDRRAVEAQSQQILKGLNSDHRALIVDFKLMNRGCFKRGERLC